MNEPTRVSIEKSDVEALQGVDHALKTYYATAVSDAAARSGISEREIRQWIGRDLIKQGFRGQVIGGPEPGAGGDAALDVLESDHHLIRSEARGGAPWYELSHDRLVEPVMDDNAAWEASALEPWQLEAMKWDAAKRPEGLLLTASLLAEAERWVANNPGAELLPVDIDYLAACRVERERVAAIVAAAAKNRRRAQVSLALAAAAVLLLAGAVWAFNNARNAEQEAAAALAERVEAQEALESETRRAEAAADDARQQAIRAESEANRARTAENTAEARAEEARTAERAAVAAERAAEELATELSTANDNLESTQTDLKAETADAVEARKKADDLRLEADQLRVRADEEAERAERLRIDAVAAQVKAQQAERVALAEAETSDQLRGEAQRQADQATRAGAEAVVALRHSVNFVENFDPATHFYSVLLSDYAPECAGRGVEGSAPPYGPDSTYGVAIFNLRVTNASDRAVTMYLIGENANVEIEWATIAPGSTYEEQVLGNWAWVFLDDGQSCVSLLPEGTAVCVYNNSCPWYIPGQ